MTATEIKALRTTLGLTQEKLAQKLGVALATVNRWERGLNHPHPVWVEKLQGLKRKS